MLGTYATRIKPKSSTQSHGSTEIVTSFRLKPVKELATKRFSPTGGVSIPSSIFTIIAIPK